MALLKHIVFIKCTGNISSKEKTDFLHELKTRLESLSGLIEEIKSLEVGENISKRSTAFDLSLYVEFNNEGDLAVYARHTEHINVLNFMKTIQLETAVVDYFI